ncbi:MAG: nucleoside phosphorylase [Candidatus Limiplasma sp.]|nr:nucleoside phosphorylase [Candidatus Limiplasma sp.]
MGTLYMGASPETVGEYVIFSGDPWRVEVVKKYLDDPQKVAFLREFNTYTGTYKGLRVTVTSTGIGAPSAAIAMEEMYACGMKAALRMGTVMALDDGMLGHFIIPIGAMRRESTSATYVEGSYPAVADLELVNALNQTVLDHGRRYQNGINCTMDGFYSQMRESRLSKERGADILKTIQELEALRVTGIDMESSCMLTVGRLMGVRTAVLTLATVLRNLKKVLEGQERAQAEDLLCRVALEGLHRFAGAQKEGA